jgi:hypothetical protein
MMPKLAVLILSQSAQSGGPIKGVAFWEWFDNGQVAPAAEGGGSGLYGIMQSDSTWQYIQQNAQVMKGSAASPSQRHLISWNALERAHLHLSQSHNSCAAHVFVCLPCAMAIQ